MAVVNKIADYIIHLRNEDLNKGLNVYLNNLKLQGILYFSHALFTVVNADSDERLISDEEFQAGLYGPMITKVYCRFNKHGHSEIPTKEELDYSNLNQKERIVVSLVWDIFREANAFELVQLSQVEGGPWEQVYQQGLQNIITTDNISAYYSGTE